jgi:hypothetical protein
MSVNGLRFCTGMSILFAVFLAGAIVRAWNDMDSTLWRLVFSLSLFSGWLWQFGRRGAGTLSPTFSGLGTLGL